MQVYNSLEIPVLDQDVDENNAYKLQHVRATRGRIWRGKEARRDAVWVRIESMRLRPTSVMGCLKGYQGLVTGFLNSLFTLRGSNGKLHKLAHVALLEWAGNPTPEGPEGMSEVKDLLHGGGQTVVWLRTIEGVAHLIPVEPEPNWIVNNRVDYHVWNEMNDV